MPLFSLHLDVHGLQTGHGKCFMRVLEKSWMFLSVNEWEPWLLCGPNVFNTRSRNLHQKLVQVVLYQKLACMSVFFWYKFLAHNWTQLSSSSETVRHEPCNVIGRRVVLVQETVITSVKFFMQVSGTSFLSRHKLVLCCVSARGRDSAGESGAEDEAISATDGRAEMSETCPAADGICYRRRRYWVKGSSRVWN